MSIKKVGKNILCRVLEAQVQRLQKASPFTMIAVAGSVGKTSTKLAIAKTLSSRQKVCYQEGNYNDRLTVPLVLFRHTEPAIYNIFAWTRIVLANERTIRRGTDYKLAVLELGTDGPGQMKDFRYLKPDILVLTSIAEEHMQYFGNLAAVAAEELILIDSAKRSLLNIDDIAPEYLPSTEFVGYGFSKKSDYRIVEATGHGLLGQTLTLVCGNKSPIDVQVSSLGKQGAKIALAAAAVADILEWKPEHIKRGLQMIAPAAGRLQILGGVHQSTLIDDTYNASPIAVTAALNVLYTAETPQRIAILGTMNELGDQSADSHTAIGAYCDPGKLDLVVTIGQPAANYLAPAAVKRGCKVKCFDGPYEAGEYVKQAIKNKAVVLAKGSQNGVFAEEALKALLQDPADAQKLVRQSEYWLHTKRQQFPRP